MSRQNLQIPDYGRKGNGAFSTGYHTDMIRDRTRVESFQKAILKVIKPGMRVLECGCGTGVLSIMSAQLGAEVVALEVDPKVIKIARRNFKKHKVNVQLLEIDAGNLYKEHNDIEKFDVLIAELMSIWCIEEPQVPIVNYLRNKCLKNNGAILPGRISNLMSVGYFLFGNEIVDCPYPFARYTGIPDAIPFTETKLVNQLDFYSTLPKKMEGDISYRSFGNGIINCVQISSLVEIIPGVNFYTSDTLMPVTILPLTNPRTVKCGQQIKIKYRYTHRGLIENSRFSIFE